LVTAIIPTANSLKQFVVATKSVTPLQINIVNNAGQQVLSVMLEPSQLLDCSGLAAGIYYTRFSSADGITQVEKLLVR
jgi:hypothetical protein